MKKSYLLILFFLLLIPMSLSYGQFWIENFDYPVGQLTSGGGGGNVSDSNWLSFSGTGFYIPVVAGSLTYPGYPASGIGNKVVLVAATTSAEDARRDYPQQSGDGTKVYASFLVNVQSTQASGVSYFAALYSTATTGGGYRSRVFVQTATTGIQFGFEGGGTTPVFYPTEFPLNTTVLIVISYEFLVGTDSAKIWVNPTVSTSEPPADITFGITSEPPYLNAFALRQASTGGVAQTPDAEIDGIIVGNTWLQVVPVEFTSFSSVVNGNNVILNWSTATELNNFGFEIQRAAAGNEFSTIGFVPGYGTTTEAKTYRFVDANLSAGNYTYRLKQIDFNGTFAYSDEVNTEVTSLAQFELAQNYPNPFNPSTTIKFSIPQSSSVTLKIFNTLGQEVSIVLNENLEAGFHTIDFNASELNSGVYFYRLDAGSFSEVKKMTLIK
jgi:hypothetical protein